jgi:hypothetical protein
MISVRMRASHVFTEAFVISESFSTNDASRLKVKGSKYKLLLSLALIRLGINFFLFVFDKLLRIAFFNLAISHGTVSFNYA